MVIVVNECSQPILDNSNQTFSLQSAPFACPFLSVRRRKTVLGRGCQKENGEMKKRAKISRDSIFKECECPPSSMGWTVSVLSEVVPGATSLPQSGTIVRHSEKAWRIFIHRPLETKLGSAPTRKCQREFLSLPCLGNDYSLIPREALSSMCALNYITYSILNSQATDTN